jgi:prepilin-type N-terminal cleavage/methylation domain-containing protein
MSGPVALRPRGFVLAELLVALVIAAIIGVALTQLVISQSRFAALQGGIIQARGGARAALNVMSSDFRMVSDSGLVAAAHDSVTVRVPYAFGVACGQVGGNVTVSLLPADSASYSAATASGYAWRDTTGKMVFVQPTTVTSSSTGNCTNNLITNPPITTLSVTGWPALAVAVPNDSRRIPPGPPQGSVVYLYQLVRYAFAPSGQLPGRIGLWRTVLSTGERDELVAPFDTSASFQFLVGSRLTARSTPPAVLDSVQGLRLNLVAASEQPPEGRTKPETFTITTNVVFENHP